MLGAFGADRRGNYATVFALLSTGLLLAGSLALDTARVYSTQTKLTQAIDAAVLATTRGLTQGDIPIEDAEKEVLAYIEANLDGRNLKSGDIVIDDIIVNTSDNSLQVEAHTMMPMTMGGLVGYNEQRVDVLSKAQFANTNVEVVMALDVTGSMGSAISYGSSTTKLAALKNASQSGIDTLLGDGSNDRVRVGLVPYSEAVNIGNYRNDIEVSNDYVCTEYGYSGSGFYCKNGYYKSTKCVRERTGTYNYSDTFANSSAKIPLSDNACPNAQITPLSNNPGNLKGKISTYSAGGGTAGHIAIAWTYYMLSSKWNSVWPADSEAADFGAAGTSKYAIIMTDGEFNTFESAPWWADNAYKKGQSETYAKGICTAMKADGIKIYSIAFNAGASGESLMNECASPDSDGNKQYYNATDEASLTKAFEDIAQDIQGLRLVN